MSYYVYIHYTEPDSRVFYVGKTKNIRRLTQKTRTHQSAWTAFTNTHEWSAELVHTFATDEEACEHERWLINYFREEGHPLLNQTNGGNSMDGYRWSDEMHKRMKPVQQARGLKGGHAKSEAKAAAARLNGAKGGRGKKRAAII